jgi:hypothetical protein
MYWNFFEFFPLQGNTFMPWCYTNAQVVHNPQYEIF